MSRTGTNFNNLIGCINNIGNMFHHDYAVPTVAQIDHQICGRVETLARAKVKDTLHEALSRARRPAKRSKIQLIDKREYARIRNQLLDMLDLDGPVSELTAWRALVQDTQAVLTRLGSTST